MKKRGEADNARVLLKFGAIYQNKHGELYRYAGFTHSEFVFQIFRNGQELSDTLTGPIDRLEEFYHSEQLVMIHMRPRSNRYALDQH